MKKQRVNSITFPAIGPGGLCYPSQLVASIMISESCKFLAKTKNTSFKVHLVIFEKTVHKTFQDELEKIRATPTRSASASAVNSLLEVPRKLARIGAAEMPFLDVSRKLPQIGTTSSATAVPEFSIHSIQVMVIKGDITKDSSDAIVNTTSSEINLSSSGQVSAALLKIAGSKLQDLCTAAVKSEGQLTEGNVISTTAPKPLSCTSIFHIYFRSNDSAMYEATIEACLKKAEQLQYRTIAFPAIGTGAQKYPSSQAAKGILEGVKKFALSGPRNLKEVRLVIYQQSVYDDFVAITTGQQEHETLSEYDSDKSLLYDSDSSQSDTEILSGSISDETRKSEDSKSTPVGESNWLVKTFSNLLPSTPWTESDTSKVTKATQDPFARGLKLKIYGFDQKQVDIAAKRLMEIMKENFDSARIEDQIISSLNQEDCDKIHTECRALGVECRIERDIGSIHISGNVQDIHKIKDVVHALLRKVMSRKTKEQRQELQRGYEIDGCFNRVKWQYMGLNQGKHKFEDYDKEVSYDIEQAFKLFEADGQKYRFNYSRVPFNFRVDFKNHEEKDRKTNARRRVRRYDVMHEAARIGMLQNPILSGL